MRRSRSGIPAARAQESRYSPDDLSNRIPPRLLSGFGSAPPEPDPDGPRPPPRRGPSPFCCAAGQVAPRCVVVVAEALHPPGLRLAFFDARGSTSLLLGSVIHSAGFYPQSRPDPWLLTGTRVNVGGNADFQEAPQCLPTRLAR